MKETQKTVVFLIAAVALAGSAWAAHKYTVPKSIDSFELVGKDFFPEFADPSEARFLEVAIFDADENRVRKFTVEQVDGVWRIPSHHNYPAEAGDRLAQTASSIMGLKRESLVGRRDNQHEQFGVVDPTSDEARDPETAGKRITLRDGKGDVLADYIIGHKAENVVESAQDSAFGPSTDPSKVYYVRVPDNSETFKTTLNLDLSARFADWIDPDLLQMDITQLRKISIDRYRLAEQRVSVPGGEMLQYAREDGELTVLTRDDELDPWHMAGLDETTQELNRERVNAIVDVIQAIQISGVRPKFSINGKPLLTADLKLNPIPELKDQRLLQAALQQLAADLGDRGFAIGPDESGELQVLCKQGELTATTDRGVVYNLNVGDIVIGDEADIEIGDLASGGADNSDPAEDGSAQPEGASQQNESLESAEPEDGDSPPGESGSGKNRYVMVRVSFDEAALGEIPVKPTEPTAPEKPDGYDAWKTARDAAEQEKAEDGADESAEDAEQESEDDAPLPPDTSADEVDKVFTDYEAAIMAYEKARSEHGSNLNTYNQDLEEYNRRKEEGRGLADKLNQRFQNWYYVITAENLEKLQPARSELVSIKEADPEVGNPLNAPPGGEAPGFTLPQRPEIEFAPGDENATPPGKDDAEATDDESTDDESIDDKAPAKDEAGDTHSGGGDGSKTGDKEADDQQPGGGR